MGVSVRDIAKVVGVGRTTVSLALRGAPGVAAATRARILEEAHRMGYRSDPLIARLAKHRWHPPKAAPGIAWLPFGRDEGLKDHLVQALADYGYRFEDFTFARDFQPRRLCQVLLARGVEGLFLGPVDAEFVREFEFSYFACVSLAVGTVRMPVHQIRADVARAVATGWVEAWKRGYRRIGLVLFNQPDARDFLDRKGAFLALTHEHQAPPIPPLLLQPDRDHAALLSEWYGQWRPDCVLGLNPHVFWQLRESGIRMPQDAGFISLISPATRPERFAYLDSEHAEVARAGAWMLHRLILDHQRGIPTSPWKLLLPVRFYPGLSLDQHKSFTPRIEVD